MEEVKQYRRFDNGIDDEMVSECSAAAAAWSRVRPLTSFIRDRQGSIFRRFCVGSCLSVCACARVCYRFRDQGQGEICVLFEVAPSTQGTFFLAPEVFFHQQPVLLRLLDNLKERI